jgi:hypothetical protein
MKNILLVFSAVMLLCTGCYAKSAYFKSEETADLRRCENFGWGIIGTPSAVTAHKECVSHYQELGYEQITKEEYKKLIQN